MFFSVAILLVSAGVIYCASELFVNGIEWLGRKLGVSQTATGTVLAAFGTALPESVITLVAVAFGNGTAGKEIGIGAALGGPLALGTVAYGVVGFSLLMNRKRLDLGRRPAVCVDERRLSHDQMWFLAIFAVKVLLGIAVFSYKAWLGVLFLTAYGFYVWKELGDDGDRHEGDLEPLTFRKKDADPALPWVLLQTFFSLAVIFTASKIFVGQIETVGHGMGIGPQMTALLLSPLATELPEVMNAVIWVRQGKEKLALANISGAMMIQATIPTAIGLFFTPWVFTPAAFMAAGVTALAVLCLMIAFRKGAVNGFWLAQVAWLYLVFAAALPFLRE